MKILYCLALAAGLMIITNCATKKKDDIPPYELTTENQHLVPRKDLCLKNPDNEWLQGDICANKYRNQIALCEKKNGFHWDHETKTCIEN